MERSPEVLRVYLGVRSFCESYGLCYILPDGIAAYADPFYNMLPDDSVFLLRLRAVQVPVKLPLFYLYQAIIIDDSIRNISGSFFQC